MPKHLCRIVLVSAFAASVVLATPAQAQNNETKVVTQGTTVADLAIGSVPQGERCSARRTERWGKNIFGRKVIRYFQSVKWCWNRNRITYTRRRTNGETPGIGWDFKGTRNAYRDASRSRGRWYRFVATGKFAACGSIREISGCVNKFFTVRQTVFRGGGYSTDTSG